MPGVLPQTFLYSYHCFN